MFGYLFFPKLSTGSFADNPESRRGDVFSFAGWATTGTGQSFPSPKNEPTMLIPNGRDGELVLLIAIKTSLHMGKVMFYVSR
ncbi:MAG: hypothetical protein NPIRA02_22690 [Nitrospirales bacterium]|nr:MAG: hypothetical protein NPIRA02_22690 [Nitrospirales bacterium]